MSEKNKNNNNGEQQKQAQTENKKKDNNGGKNNLQTVVLKADLHCDGCASKVLKCIRTFDGAENATIGEGLITVAGKFDPAKLREKVERETHKRVEVISPQPKKENTNNNGDNKGSNKKEKKENNSNGESKENVKGKDNNGGNKKSKETKPQVTTAVMKVQLHCNGCINKIHKIVTKTKGYQEIKIDMQKELVTITGAMDMKALAVVLKKHLKRDIQIVPPKKEIETKDNAAAGGKAKSDGGSQKKKSDSGGGDVAGGEVEKKKSGSGGEKKKGGGGGGSDMAGGGREKVMEEKRGEFHAPSPCPFMYAPPGSGGEQFYYYNTYAVGPYHAPQMFSDENPNACNAM